MLRYSGKSEHQSRAKLKRNIGKEILSGLQELRRGEHGRVTSMPNVAQIRESTGLSQARFEQLLGVSPRTLQDWEQGRRTPTGPAMNLLRLYEAMPEATTKILSEEAALAS